MSDAIEKQIERAYRAWENDRRNLKHSLAIAALYEQRKEYANAVPWLRCAFETGDGVDSSIERRLFDLQMLAIKAELADLQAASKKDIDCAAHQKCMDEKLEELNRLLKVRKKDREQE